MPDVTDLLPSWRPGTTRDAIAAFLRDAADLAPTARLAVFDNDGTLWCERPTYVQYEFLVDALRRRVVDDPRLAEDPTFAAVLAGDADEIGRIGLAKVAGALVGLFDDRAPEDFAAAVATFVHTATHTALARPMRSVVYRPMLELIDALRAHGFTIAISTGGGAEFVRAISEPLYGIPRDRVVGTLIHHRVTTDGPIALRRTSDLIGGANEGPAKVEIIYTLLGRRPTFAAGNSRGDLEMLQWAAEADGPSLGLLVDHDDDEREYAYEGRAETVAQDEPITATARRLGWTVVSMRDDWATVFPSS